MLLRTTIRLLLAASLFGSLPFQPATAAQQQPSPVLHLDTQCQLGGVTALRDARGIPLPGAALLCDGTTPASVATRGVTLPLYAFGKSPSAALNGYGGIPRECGKLNPGYTACYSTDPEQNPSWLQDELACGYPTPPAYILSCSDAGCASEIFDRACSSAYPDAQPVATYAASPTIRDIGGVVNDGSDFSDESFHTKLDYTASLWMARRIVAQGRVAALALGPMLLNSDGTLRSDAADVLAQSIIAFPDVFNQPDLPIEAIDEPFWTAQGVPQGGALRRSIASAQAEIALIHRLLPRAQVGVVVAPVWDSYPGMIPAIESILPSLQWVAVDVYAYQFSQDSANGALRLAGEFASYMHTNHPSLPLWLVVQGFAPVIGPEPSNWTTSQAAAFDGFMTDMMNIAAHSYDGVFIWGWGDVNELPDNLAGKNFPAQVQAFYEQATR